MPFQRDLAALDGGERVHVATLRFVEPQRQAFRRAARFHELGQRRLDDFESRRLQALVQLRAGLVDDERSPDVYRVADEVHRVGFGDSDAPRGGHAHLDETIRVRVERVGIVEQIAARQRTEAGVEMIEAFIDQTKGEHFHVQPPGEQRVGVEFGARPVARPEPAALAVE